MRYGDVEDGSNVDAVAAAAVAEVGDVAVWKVDEVVDDWRRCKAAATTDCGKKRRRRKRSKERAPRRS